MARILGHIGAAFQSRAAHGTSLDLEPTNTVAAFPHRAQK
jgi:hypothetical protein